MIKSENITPTKKLIDVAFVKNVGFVSLLNGISIFMGYIMSKASL